MMKLEGIVLKTMNYKESSKILYLYTPMGKKSVLVRGSNRYKSRFLNISQPITCISYYQTNGTLPSLKDGEVLHYFDNIKNDIEKTTYISHMFELINLTISDDSNHPKMYGFILKLLHKIEQGYDPEIISYIFELKLLYFIGVGPRLKCCSKCETKENLYFKISDGILLCETCTDSFTYPHGDLLTLIRYFYYLKVEEYEEITITLEERKDIRKIIDLYYDYFVNITTTSRKLLTQFKGY